MTTTWRSRYGRRAVRLGVASLVASGLATVIGVSPAFALHTSQGGNGATLRGGITITESAPGGNTTCGAYTRISVINQSGEKVEQWGNNGGGMSVGWTTESVANGPYTISAAWTYGYRYWYGGCSLSGVSTAQVSVTVDNQASISYSGPTSAPWGAQVPVSARLVDPNLGGSPLSGQTVSFTLSGQSSVTATTNSNGVASATLAVTAPPRGATLVSGFGGTGSYDPTSTSVGFGVGIHPTALSYSGPTSAPWGSTVTESATLVDAVTATPLSGQTVSFGLSGQSSVTATTNSNGVASAQIAVESPARSATLAVGFAGTTLYQAASTPLGFTVTSHPTKIVYSGPTGAIWGTPVALRATLTDATTAVGIGGVPVTFTLGKQSASAVTDANGLAQVTLTPDQAPGSYSLAVSFPGDADNGAAHVLTTFRIHWQYSFVDAKGNGTVKVNPGTNQFLLEAPSSSPTQSFGPITDPSMTVVALPSNDHVIDITYTSPALVLQGDFVEETGQFAAVADSASAIYALSNTGVAL